MPLCWAGSPLAISWPWECFLSPLEGLQISWDGRKFFLGGVFLYTLSCLLTALSNSATSLIAFRALQGIGASMVFGTSVAILTSVFPADERGKALGINVAAVYSGLSLGPFLGGLLTQYLGWRSIFWVNIPLGLVVIGFAFWKLKGEWAEARGERFDVMGSILYCLSLVATIYGISLLPGRQESCSEERVFWASLDSLGMNSGRKAPSLT